MIALKHIHFSYKKTSSSAVSSKHHWILCCFIIFTECRATINWCSDSLLSLRMANLAFSCYDTAMLHAEHTLWHVPTCGSLLFQLLPHRTTECWEGTLATRKKTWESNFYSSILTGIILYNIEIIKISYMDLTFV